MQFVLGEHGPLTTVLRKGLTVWPAPIQSFYPTLHFLTCDPLSIPFSGDFLGPTPQQKVRQKTASDSPVLMMANKREVCHAQASSSLQMVVLLFSSNISLFLGVGSSFFANLLLSWSRARSVDNPWKLQQV